MKGGGFEREISKALSLCLTKGEKFDEVWRTPGSGGRATNRKRANKNAKVADHGDLCADGDDTRFFFEIFNAELKTGYAKKIKSKKGKTVTLWSLIDILDSRQKKPLFNNFWEQSVKDAENSHREPLLIFRRNGRQACIAMREDIFRTMVDRFGQVAFPYVIISGVDPLPITICNFNAFTKWATGKLNQGFVKYRITRTLLRRK